MYKVSYGEPLGGSVDLLVGYVLLAWAGSVLRARNLGPGSTITQDVQTPAKTQKSRSPYRWVLHFRP